MEPSEVHRFGCHASETGGKVEAMTQPDPDDHWLEAIEAFALECRIIRSCNAAIWHHYWNAIEIMEMGPPQ